MLTLAGYCRIAPKHATALDVLLAPMNLTSAWLRLVVDRRW